MKINKSLSYFKTILNQIQWPTPSGVLKLLDVSENVKMSSEKEDLIFSICASDASQRKIGVGLTKFSLIRSIYLDEKNLNSDKNFSLLLIPPKSIFWKEGRSKEESDIEYSRFIKNQLLISFDLNKALPTEFKKFLLSEEDKIDFSVYKLREIVEFSAQMKVFENSQDKMQVLLVDGYFTFSFLKNLTEGENKYLIDLNDFFLKKNVVLCGVVKEGYVLDHVFYQMQQLLDSDYNIFRIDPDDVFRFASNELKILYDSEDIKEKSKIKPSFCPHCEKKIDENPKEENYEDVDSRDSLSVSEQWGKKLKDNFKFYVVAHNKETLPFLVQLWRGLPEQEHFKILKKIAESSLTSHPILGYPNLLNEAHNQSYIGPSETDMLEKMLKEVLVKNYQTDSNLDLRFEIIRNNRRKTR